MKQSSVSYTFLILLFAIVIGIMPVTGQPVRHYQWNEFSMGADLSYVAQLKDKGISYKEGGKTEDIFKMFKEHGCNTVRIRLFHTPKAFGTEWDQLYNDYDHVEALIQQAKAQGMAISLDLHYSDTWADPGKQFTPAAWASLDMTTLKDSVYQYTMKILNKLKAKNLVPEMIQIGNENNSGLLWPKGKTNKDDFTAFSQLVNSGIKAVRDFSATSAIRPLVIVHVAQVQNAEWWTNNLVKAGTTDFDILGMSHYADWSTVKTMDGITDIVQKLKAKYKKQVMIVETAYWWSTTDSANKTIRQNPVAGYPFTKEGQYQYLKDLTQAVIKGGGTGIHYWAPDYISSWGGEMTDRSLFDFDGNANPGLDFMMQAYKF